MSTCDFGALYHSADDVDFRPALAENQQITGEMRQIRGLKLDDRQSVYASERIGKPTRMVR